MCGDCPPPGHITLMIDSYMSFFDSMVYPLMCTCFLSKPVFIVNVSTHACFYNDINDKNPTKI